ncbi:hypothetical protein BMWSH_2211 [Priestia megaterium WSH-002]|uniref:Uncharacterized protein n=1 Tax=Priestia megaterium (strain WSH-002) TaxID=1006007 RepID=A0A8D4BJG0_PRIMW|nr:hypothetical protein BMWSH_2211 [Priestia megaterium WSH-002]
MILFYFRYILEEQLFLGKVLSYFKIPGFYHKKNETKV